MEAVRLSVTKRIGRWGLVYNIGGSAADGDVLPSEQADDIMARFFFERSLRMSPADCVNELGSQTRRPLEEKR